MRDNYQERSRLQQATKQRIVGSVVLIALALIILPIVFDGQGSYESEITSRIPETPIIESLTPPIATRPIIRADQPEFQNENSDEPSVTSEIEDSPADPETIDAIAQQEPAATEMDADEDGEGNSAELADVVISEPAYVREAPELGPDGLPRGWSVRLGTFSDKDNAEALLERLLASGYKAYTKELEREQGILTAVLVGPRLDRNRIDELQEQLQSEFQLAGIVERYTIDSL